MVSYPDPSDPARTVTLRFWLQNRVDPRIVVTLKRNPDEKYVYDYTMGNGPDAKTAIWKWSLVGPPSKELTVSHPVWRGVNAYQSVEAPQALFKSVGKGSYLAWMDARATAPIKPGQQLSGFEITSALSPGLATAYVSGWEQPITVSEDAPEAVDQQIMLLERAPVMNKVAATIGPRFSPDAKQSDIVRAYQRDIEDLKTDGLLDGNSRFLEELGTELAKAETSDQYMIVAPKDPPGTSLEREILEALQLALHRQ